MRRIVVDKTSTNHQLSIRSFEYENTLPADQVEIDVKAAGVNFSDILARKGLHPDAPEPSFVPGYEVAGVVSTVGESVSKSWLGKKVVALTPFGGYTEKLRVTANYIYDMPPRLSFAEAAGMPVVYLTAWQSLITMGALQDDDWVLIHNIGGGVGLAAIEVARLYNTTIIGTASKHKHPALKERGVDHLIDYNHENWEAIVKHLTGGKGVELILDPIGGTHWRKSYNSLRITGRLGLFGISIALNNRTGRTMSLLKTAIGMPFFHPIALMNGNKAVFGVNLGQIWQEHDKVRKWMDAISTHVEAERFNPSIDRIYSFEDANLAHRYIEERKNIGKVVLVT